MRKEAQICSRWQKWDSRPGLVSGTARPSSLQSIQLPGFNENTLAILLCFSFSIVQLVGPYLVYLQARGGRGMRRKLLHSNQEAISQKGALPDWGMFKRQPFTSIVTSQPTGKEFSLLRYNLRREAKFTIE